jgi:hypothetical protein
VRVIPGPSFLCALLPVGAPRGRSPLRSGCAWSAGRQATRATTQLFAAQHLLDLRSYYVDYRRHHKPRHLCRALVGIRYPSMP